MLYEAIPQDWSAIQNLVQKYKDSICINYDVEFDAIQEQISQSEKWDERAQLILKLDIED